jgi:hypothetical protein
MYQTFLIADVAAAAAAAATMASAVTSHTAARGLRVAAAAVEAESVGTVLPPETLFAKGATAAAAFPTDARVLWARLLAALSNVETISRIDR